MIGEKDIQPLVEHSFAKAAVPLGLTQPPYNAGVRYEERLICYTIRNPLYLAPLQTPAMAVMETVLYDQSSPVTAGRLADSLLVAIGFLPSFLHVAARRFHTTPAAIEEDLYQRIAGLYAKSKNPQMREERRLIAQHTEIYADCMKQASVRLRETESMQAVYRALDDAVAEQAKQIPSIITVDDLFSQN